MQAEAGDLLEDLIEYAKQVSYYVENHADMVPRQTPSPNLECDRSRKGPATPNAHQQPKVDEDRDIQLAKCSLVTSPGEIGDPEWPRHNWEHLQKHPENDLCVIASPGGAKRVFSIEHSGLILRPVSGSRSELSDFRRPGALSEILFQQWKLWEGRLTHYAQAEPLAPTIAWNGLAYRWQDGSYTATGVPDSYKAYYAQYCKYYSRLGYCSNKPCRYVHDRRNRGLCRSVAAGHTCATGRQCPLLHEPNEYIAEDCPAFHAGSCPHTHGAVDTFDRQRANPLLRAGLCHRVHRAPPAAADHLCRPFAYTSFCFRGLQCPFLHLKLCPDFYSTGTCFILGCQLYHELPEPYCRPASLAALEPAMYLLPPWGQSATTPLPSVWYGLRSLQQSLDEAGAAQALARLGAVALQASGNSHREEACSTDVSTDYSSADSLHINSDVECNNEDFVRL
ncbi:FAFR079Cp [Eremothecium gossypii FDAG1]|nr:FAFR079Cp [Eremothecium gossypii FDAG1]